MFGTFLYMAHRPGCQENLLKYLGNLQIWCWRRMEKIKWSEEVANEEVLERLGEKRMLLNNILHRKASLVCHILRRN
jgi:hypothetical protein